MNRKTESTLSVRKILSYTLSGLLGLAGIFALAYFGFPSLFSVSYTAPAPVASAASSTAAVSNEPPAPIVEHVAAPENVRAIYMSQCVAGTKSFRESLVKFIEDSSLNAVVIDIKDYSGGIGFPTDDPLLAANVSKSCGANDMRSFVKSLHEKNIYVIGRITTFQDPTYAKAHPETAVKTKEGGIWKNFGGLAFVDVGAKPFWDYIVELSKVSYQQMGFDELNFDYIRFPSDGPMADADYTFDVGKSKAQALEEFFQYLSSQLKPTGVLMSADLFGYVTVHEDDLGIGQVLERAMPYFDFIDPMVYPSHYNSGFAGLKNVNSDPYKVVHVSMVEAVARALAPTTTVEAIAETPIMKEEVVPATATTATTTRQVPTGTYSKVVYPASKLRPWLQSFDYPVVYTPQMVADQIKANEDAGLYSYLMWDAANKYTALRKVLAAPSAAQ